MSHLETFTKITRSINKLQTNQKYKNIYQKQKKGDKIRKMIADINHEQQPDLLCRLLKVIFGEDLATAANLSAKQDDILQSVLAVNDESTLRQALDDMRNIYKELVKIEELALVQAKIDTISIQIAQLTEKSRIFKVEQEKEFYKSEEIDKRNALREKIHEEIKKFIQENIEIPTELSREDLATIRVSKFTEQPIPIHILEKVAQINRGRDIVANSISINMDPEVEEQFKDLIIKIDVPNVPFKILACLAESVVKNDLVDVKLYLYGTKNNAVAKYDYPLNEEQSKIALQKLQ